MPSETYVCQLTPTGRGALSTIAVCGPTAVDTVVANFVAASGRRPKQGRIAFGHWRDATGEEVVVAVRDADHVEIHCHGGRAAVAKLIDDLVESGCLLSDPTALLDHKGTDPIERAARLALPKARTRRTAEILLDQLNGALHRELCEIISDLQEQKKIGAERHIELLIQRGKVGLHLTEPWKIVIGGPPNVGKSSLINALVGYERAIVFDQPGTTRDVVTATAALDGWPVEFSDTAGIRDNSSDEIEVAGIDRARLQFQSADLRILVFDATQPANHEDRTLAASSPNAIVVYNKIDLTNGIHENAARQNGFAISATRGDGIHELCQEIIQRLSPASITQGDAIPFTQPQADCLSSALHAVQIGDSATAIATLNSMLGTHSIAANRD